MSNPIKKFKCGAITASVWLTSTASNHEIIELHTIKIDKVYKKDEEWNHTYSFTAEDLPKIALLANETYKFIRLRVLDKENDCREDQH